MIISCPSCNTRYRFPASAAPTVKHAQCSRCDERFPLASVSTYRIEQSRQAAPPMPPASPGLKIGMDCPTLADQVAGSLLGGDGTSAGAMTYRVDADPPADTPPPVDDPAATLALPSLELDSEPPAPMMSPAAEREPADADASMEVSPSVSESHGRPLRDLLVALLAASLGAASGYYGPPYLAPYLQADIVTWTAAGSAVGLLTGWVLIRWMARRS
jgi:hypothetical protein